MRYRKLDANGDYTFGNQQVDFYRNSPEVVAQAVQTRLQLNKGEWFLDVADGMPWSTEVLGERTVATRDAAVKKRILGTNGVIQIDTYTSSFAADTRRFTVSATITTAYGQTTISETL
ncbi:hypothetical protein [Pseudomonas sichuanensis]|uniref:hypothetical protein n=1 Tax=Pseudomonas sichuanensis TaxID=2213015 RepID=UPI000DA6CE26|nr:hypothetical protein [Pseudomonas sichuanensis]